MTEQEKRRLYEEYTADDMKKLKGIVLSQVRKFCGDANLHWDDYFSIANMTLWRVIECYDETKCNNFYAFLVDCLRRKIKTELTKINNNASVSTSTKTISFDFVNDGGLVLAETIDSKKSISDALDRYHLSEFALEYVEQFDGQARTVIEMIMEGYSNDEIQKLLKLSRREFDDIMTKLKSYKNSAVLRKTDKQTRPEKIEKVEENNMLGEHYFNRSKTESPTVRDIKDRVEYSELLLDYVMQRDENQWTCEGKSNQISDMLQMNPLPGLVFAQRNNPNGTFLTFVIDGKQRITNVLSFINNGWKVSKKVRRWNIRYEEVVGEENGIPQSEWREFDIRNKRFSDLPERLQRMLFSYQFDSRVYINCSDDDIAYHISRYNDGKAMNSNQKSILKIGYDYASRIRKITDMEFFQNQFKTSEEQKGVPEKICVETIMATNYLDDWKKKNEDNAGYLAAYGTKEAFDDLEESVDRMNDVLDDETRKLINAKDGFIFITLFNKFKELDLDDTIFNDFLVDFIRNLQDVKINDASWKDYLAMRNTKDKLTVTKKIEHLYQLLTEYISKNVTKEEVKEVESESNSNEEDDDDYLTPTFLPTHLFDLADDDEEEESSGKEEQNINDHYRGDNGYEETPDSVLDIDYEEGGQLPRLPEEDLEEEPSWEDLLFDD